MASDPPALAYRPEIDGLRAIAVVVVILFHAGFSPFSGGFIGVDVFFVISGYLITGILVKDAAAERFSIATFYERRARRILPALTLVLVVSTMLALLVLPGDRLQEYGQSLVATATFLSNVFFFLESDYFATASEEQPLLHTWSLAIEEQFYLVFPLLVALCWRLGRLSLRLVTVAIFICSLGYSEYLLHVDRAASSFYLIGSRAWELAVGALVALFSLERSLAAKGDTGKGLETLGLAMILVPVFIYDAQTPFPGLHALIPVAGTALLIVHASPTSLTGRLLAHRTMVGVGLISYSLYLWHQPLLAFLRVTSIGHPGLPATLAILSLSYALAYLSWRYVEAPFRSRTFLTKTTLLLGSGATLALLGAIGLVGHLANGFPTRMAVADNIASSGPSPMRGACHTKGLNYLAPTEACRYGGSLVRWAALGDSHVTEPAYALAQQLAAKDIGLLHLSFSGCPPALSYKHYRPGCSNWLQEAVALIENSPTITNVLVSFRHTSALYGDHGRHYPDLPSRNPAADMVGNEHLDAKTARKLYWQSFEKLVERLTSAGKNIMVMTPIPELPADISNLAAPRWVFSNESRANLRQALPRSYYDSRTVIINQQLSRIAQHPQVHLLDSSAALCNPTWCTAVVDHALAYFDDNHLSVAGATAVIRTLGSTPRLNTPLNRKSP